MEPAQYDFHQNPPDTFDDIYSRDSRYDPFAYHFVMSVYERLFEQADASYRTVTEFLDEFCDCALDDFGPMAYTVLRTWGLESSTDIGEIVANLEESGRVGKLNPDERADFIGAIDFRTEFIDPYKP